MWLLPRLDRALAARHRPSRSFLAVSNPWSPAGLRNFQDVGRKRGPAARTRWKPVSGGGGGVSRLATLFIGSGSRPGSPRPGARTARACRDGVPMGSGPSQARQSADQTPPLGDPSSENDGRSVPGPRSDLTAGRRLLAAAVALSGRWSAAFALATGSGALGRDAATRSPWSRPPAWLRANDRRRVAVPRRPAPAGRAPRARPPCRPLV
jgi:hypothetical protein